MTQTVHDDHVRKTDLFAKYLLSHLAIAANFACTLHKPQHEGQGLLSPDLFNLDQHFGLLIGSLHRRRVKAVVAVSAPS